MVDFSERFIEAMGAPITYKGKTLIMSDHIPVEKYFKAEIELISVNSPYRQGIRLSTKGIIDVGENLKGKDHVFWQELWTEKDLGPIQIEGISKNGIFWVYNSCMWNGCHEAWVCNAAMIKEVVGENEYIYHCNDGELDDDFDDIVFRVKILEGAKQKEVDI